MELTLSASVYENINIGEDVIVPHYDGVFHIPFFMVETLPDTFENR